VFFERSFSVSARWDRTFKEYRSTNKPDDCVKLGMKMKKMEIEMMERN